MNQKNIFLIYANFGEQKSNENGIFCENSRMPSDTMNDEKAEFMLRGMDVILARETRGHRTPTARDTEDSYSATEMPNTEHRGQMSAKPMSGSNPDA